MKNPVISLSSPLLRMTIRCVNNERTRLTWMEQAYDKAIEAIAEYAESGTRDASIHDSMVDRRNEIIAERTLASELVVYLGNALSESLRYEYEERTASDWIPAENEED